MLRHFGVALCALTSAMALMPRADDDEGSKTHTVRVGWSGFKFTPNVTNAKVGDVVEFEFYPPDHSVVQSHYEHGCIPYEYVDEGEDGFYSGPQILSGISDDKPKFRVEINNTDPIFFYCGAVGSCKDKHMIGAINPNKDQTLEGYLASVEQADFELVPGQDWPTEGEDGDDESDSDSGSQPPAAPANSDNSHHSLSPGAIAGIAIGGVAVLLIAAALIYLCGRRGGKDNAYRKSLMGQWGHKGPPPSPFQPVAAMEPKTMTPMTMGTGQEWNSPMASPGYMATTHQHAMEVPDGSHYTGASISGDPRVVSQITASPPPDTPPIELPASQDPGNSPLPMYRQLSWRQGGEAEYRPVK